MSEFGLRFFVVRDHTQKIEYRNGYYKEFPIKEVLKTCGLAVKSCTGASTLQKQDISNHEVSALQHGATGLESPL